MLVVRKVQYATQLICQKVLTASPTLDELKGFSQELIIKRC